VAKAKDKKKAPITQARGVRRTPSLRRPQRHLYLLQRVKGQKKLSAAEVAELAEYEAMAKAKDKKKGANNASKGCPPDTFTTQKAAAKYARVGVRTIQRWKHRGMPVIDLGSGRVGYTKAMLDKFKRMAESDEQNILLKTEEIGIKSIRRQREKIKLNIEKGQFIPTEQVEEWLKERILATKNILMGLQRKLPPRLKGKPYNLWGRIIRDEIYYCLDVLAGKKVKRGRKKTGQKKW